MPDLIRIVERLAERPAVALLHEKRCLSAREMSDACTVCAEVCPVGAIAVLKGRVEVGGPSGSVKPAGPAGPRIDGELCVRCGRCITACKLGALVALPPHDDVTLLEATARAARSAAEMPPRQESVDESAPAHPAAMAFVCEKVAAGARLDAERTVVVSCLGWVDEALIVHAVCGGAHTIALATADCASCELNTACEQAESSMLPEETPSPSTTVATCRTHCNATARAAERILDAGCLSAQVVCGNVPPSLMAPSDADAAGEVSRRGLLAAARSKLVGAAASAATEQIEAARGVVQDKPEVDVRRWQLLDDLNAVGFAERDEPAVPRELAPRVALDVAHCSGCALCAVFCPTGALAKVGKASGGRTVLAFDPALCRDCGVCRDTCRYDAVLCDETLTPAELFTLEPLETIIPKRRVIPART